MPNIAYIDSTFDKSTLMERYLYAPFTIISREDNNTIYCFLDRNTPESHRLSMEYSLDLGVTWHTVSSVWNGGSATEIATINKGETVMFAAANESYKLLSGNELYPTFSTTGEFDVMGLLSTIGGGGAEGSMGLLKGTKVVDASKLVLSDTGHPNYYGFAYMFQNCTYLIAAPKLPATELSQYCYTGMFAGCTKLQNAPELPATELSQGCYSGMFNSCASLTVPPILPAKTLAAYCYSDMFNGCHNLKYAPALPATTLANGCYYYMFKDCVSITEAPDLEAQTLPTNCYAYMFNGCSSLNYIKINATSRESDSISNWVADVAPSGTFVKNPSATYTIDSPSGVPIGWTLFNIGEDIKNSYNIRLSVSPNGAGTVTGNGSYNHGDTVTVTATAATGYKFVRWEQYVGGSKRETVSFDASYSFTVNNNVHLLAVFVDSEEVLENNTEYFYIRANEDACEVYVKIDEDFVSYFNNSYTLHYKINDGSWYTRTITYTLSSGEQRIYIAQLSANDKLYLGADYNAYAIMDEWNEMHIGPRFDVTKGYSIWGNILSLLYYSDNPNSTSTEFYYYENVDIADYCFYNFFESQTELYAVANSVFKDVTIGRASFGFMFNGCTGLASVVNLPYTTLAPYCYYYMFNGCKDMTRAKDLPATTMAEACYCNMFRGCINLTTPPALPATTLADACYKDMFYECYRLQQAPALPATTLAEACYEEMFYKCTSLTTPPALPATNLDVYCYDHMFVECTSLTTAPALPATTLANGCYQYMFGGCTNIQQAPELPAPILVSNCYAYMFQHCKSLNYIKIYATERQENSLYNWVEDVAWYGTFIKMQNTEYPIDSNHGIPEGWTIYNMDGSSMLYNVHIVNSNLNGGEIEVMYNHFSPLPLDSEVPAGSNITVIAHPFTGYSFDGWADESGVLVYSNPSYTFIVNSDVTLVASWDTSELPTYYTITTVVGTPNGGTTTGGGTYVAGSKVTLTATANNGYRFSNWVESSTGTVYPSYQISFNALVNETYTAKFDKIEDITPSVTDYENMYFTVESLANNNEVFVSFYRNAGGYLAQSDFSIEYKHHTDGYWQYKNIYDITTPVNSYKFLLNSGEKISFRNFDFGSNNLKCNIHITGSANYNVYGNIASLDKRVASSNSTDSYFANDCPLYEERYNNLFCNMFNTQYELHIGDNALVDASNLILSLKTINNDNVYDWYKFEYMFEGCTSLTGAPSLPRTYLQEDSYVGMFKYCTSLVTPPDLPATIIGNECYISMFEGCTSLSTPPSISATYMTSYACSYMFKGCTSLTTPPDLPATQLSRYCYNHMFEGCTSLVTAPELPASYINTCSYNYMFYNCSSLNYIKCLAKGDLTNGPDTHYWVYGVAEHGTFEKDENATWSIGESGIPTTWVESGNDPQIPVTSFYFSATNNDNSAGYISISPNVNGTYVEQGTTITLTAYAYNDFEFDCWKEINSNTVVGTNSTLTFTMGSSDIHIVAYWKYNEDMTGIDGENWYFTVKSVADNNELFITVYNCSDISQWYTGITQSDFTVESWKVGSQGATWTTDYDAISPSNSNHSEVHVPGEGKFTFPFGYIYYLNDGQTIRFRNISHNNSGVPYVHIECKYGYYVYGNIRSLSGYNSGSTHKYYDGTGISNRFNLSYMFGRNYSYGENIRDMVTGNYEETNNIVDAYNLVLCDPSESSFKRMFANCTSLISAPKLPATDLTNECYQQMFVNCTSLIEPPSLFATTLKYKCYDHMFYGCTSLNFVYCYASLTDSVNHTNNWLYGVAQTGTFYKNSYNHSWISGASGIPTGWSVYGRPISNNSYNSYSPQQISYSVTVSYPTIPDDRFGPSLACVTVTANGVSNDIFFGGSQTYAVTYEDYVSIKLHSYRGVAGNLRPWSVNVNGNSINLTDLSSNNYGGIYNVKWIDDNTAIFTIQVNESLYIKTYFDFAPYNWHAPNS